MPISTATKLCPQAIYIQGNYAKYREFSKRFMSILADFSPDLEPMGLDEAFINATGFESIHGSSNEMALKIKRLVKDDLGLIASIGVASCKVVAKVASDESKPDGLIVVPAGAEAAFLAPLAVGKLPGAGPKTEKALNHIGIHTIGQLAAMPLEVLKGRFGSFGVTLHRCANCIDTREVSPRGEAVSVSRETTFDRDTMDRAFLSGQLRYLAEKVGADLRRHGKQARSITLKLRYSDFTTITRSQTLPQATDADQTIFKNGDQMMIKALSTDRRAVRLIGIGVSNLTEPGKQLSLLEDSNLKLEKLNQAVDHIRSKYGFTAIQTGRTLWLKDMFPSYSKQNPKPGEKPGDLT
jgi:DNA polymerase-4